MSNISINPQIKALYTIHTKTGTFKKYVPMSTIIEKKTTYVPGLSDFERSYWKTKKKRETIGIQSVKFSLEETL